jgi:paraquat-inducible protein B
MARRYDARVVGAFVVTAVALGVVAAVYLGAGRVLQHRVPFVVVFTEDLAGLDVDAPVKFRGVPVGRVTSIHLSMGSATDPLRELRMPVVIELNQTRFREMGGEIDLSDRGEVRTLVEHGLRARIGLESFLSNRRYVALDVLPDAPPAQPARTALPYPEIPVYTEPGLAALQADATRLLARLQTLDLEGLVLDLRRAAGSVDRAGASVAVAAAALPRTLQSADAAIAAAAGAARAIEAGVTPLAADARAAFVQLRATLDGAEAAVRHVDALVDPASPLAWQLGRTLSDLQGTSRALRQLAEELDRDPSVLVRGRAEAKR